MSDANYPADGDFDFLTEDALGESMEGVKAAFEWPKQKPPADWGPERRKQQLRKD